MKRSIVSQEKNILRSLWRHIQNTTASGDIYYHIFRLFADGSTQKYGIDFIDTYSPVIMWSTLRTLFVLSKIKG